MADVELVIKISKELYDLVQNKLDFNGDLDKQKVKALMLVIDNGTPLPKTDVLDKIRAEIEQLPTNIEYPEIEYVYVTKKQLLGIIGKYKAEGSEK